MLTFQDFEKAKMSEKSLLEFISLAISTHQNSDEYKIAKEADEYDRQKNVTIVNYVQTIWSSSGTPVEDFTAANNKITSNFFHRLNTQRCTYSLGNGVTFSDDKDGSIKAALGYDFDTALKKVGYFSLIHGISFGFWNYDKLHVFKLTEFVPFRDETDGRLRAGIRFWSISKSKPMIAVLYEEDGYTEFTMKTGDPTGKFEMSKPKRGYKQTIAATEADGEQVVNEENYDGVFPIVPLWSSDLHQSTLVGM